MKIGIDCRLLETDRGGPAQYVMNMLKRWPFMTDRHQYILYFKDEVQNDDFFQHPSITRKRVPYPSWFHPILWEHISIPKQIRKDRLDLFLSPWYTLPYWVPCPKKVVAAWDISYTTHPMACRPRFQRYMHYTSRHACRKASGVLTCSYFDGRQIEKYYGVPKEKICVVQLAPNEGYAPLANRRGVEALRGKYNLPQRYILFLGKIYTRRFVDVIIEAFKRAQQDHPDVGLVLVGKNNSTHPRLDIPHLIEPLKQKERCIYIERLPEEEMVPMYNGAEWYICVSDCDGETIQLKEAMSCGVPVISSPLLRETVGENALMVENPSSQDEMERVIRKALTSNGLRTELAEKGLKWVRQFNWESIAEKSLRFIDNC